MRGDTLKGVQRPSPYLARPRRSSKSRRPGVQHRRLLCELLEDRMLLSISADHTEGAAPILATAEPLAAPFEDQGSLGLTQVWASAVA